MANFTKLSEENKELFFNVLDESSIPQYVEFELLNNEKQKELYKITKANDILETLTDGINFVIVLNEAIFDELNEDQQKKVFVECLAGVTYDPEKDLISLNKPDFTTYSGVLHKYGHEDIISLKESINSLFEKRKQEEEEAKALKKSKKKKSF